MDDPSFCHCWQFMIQWLLFLRSDFFPVEPERRRFLLWSAETPDPSGFYWIFFLLPVQHHLKRMWRFEVRWQVRLVMRALLTNAAEYDVSDKKAKRPVKNFFLFSSQYSCNKLLNLKTLWGRTSDQDNGLDNGFRHTELIKHILPQPVTLLALITQKQKFKVLTLGFNKM